MFLMLLSPWIASKSVTMAIMFIPPSASNRAHKTRGWLVLTCQELFTWFLSVSFIMDTLWHVTLHKDFHTLAIPIHLMTCLFLRLPCTWSSSFYPSRCLNNQDKSFAPVNIRLSDELSKFLPTERIFLHCYLLGPPLVRL